MNGWEWEGTTAAGNAGCGVSDDEDRARRSAEAWLSANPGATAVLGPARLQDGATTLSAYWARYGRSRQSRRLRDGRIAWMPVPAAGEP